MKPNFFLAGAPKAGTTSVSEYLNMHPDIFISPVKEPNYFINMGPNCPTADSIKNKQDYYKLFSHAVNQKAIGECSVSYMHSHEAPQRIRDELGNVKIIMILRDPSERCFSHWLMDVREGYQKLGFIEAVKKDYEQTIKGFCFSHMYIECSLYSDAIKTYRQTFGKENVLILLYDFLKLDTKSFMNTIYKFLDVSAEYDADFTIQRNEAAEPRNKFAAFLFHNMHLRVFFKKLFPKKIKASLRKIITRKAKGQKISAEEKKILMNYFLQDIINTENLLEITLDTWKNTNTI